ncbi:MAG: cyclase family protein [Sulfitobacter litoralis]|jgi:kynurenine formamidase|uniref:Cyclase family protein n=2 Tax=root TaxID=1 RepID=A0A7V1FPS3_9RHOB|nr:MULTISPECIES: cyclase family protein [Sulfitobacter]MBQ0764874.1 cyclase family protein [Sulfitobacter litoralis]MBQ0801037.1 cyclase family protein [Sulfitobacter litoralis]MCF7727270.1 cyclase family protein [Sulfitobacter sp. M22]MCF7778634.1 cyclase family protein [Sulfitobacter sp. M220]HDZ53719.1 cyclase family protein [Sulfitobacter litoralis]|tara:strand:+ start:1508 stop:2455 length:948 start_codon:yes stop_codon:yes gene_type:complete
MKLTKIIATAVSIGFGATAAWAQDCAPSQWGAEDQLGSANLISTERTLEAAKLIKQGKSMPLGIVIGPDTPAFPPRSLNLQIVQPNQHGGQKLSSFGYEGNYNDDLLQTWIGIGSQLDGLGHLGENGMYYNCLDEKEISAISGLTKLGTHAVPPLVGRAVIIDMAKHMGKDVLAAGEHFGEAEITAAMEAQQVTVKEGDIVLFHTGWTDGMMESDPSAWGSTEPGLNNEGAVFVASMNPLAVGADTWGLEAIPPKEGDKVFYGHVTLLKDNGIYILETMNTGPLVAEGVQEFMFVLGQPLIKGTVQAMINPVALY